jgi:hypothetical protein
LTQKASQAPQPDVEMVEDVIEIIFSLQKGAHSLNFQEKKRK